MILVDVEDGGGVVLVGGRHIFSEFCISRFQCITDFSSDVKTLVS